MVQLITLRIAAAAGAPPARAPSRPLPLCPDPTPAAASSLSRGVRLLAACANVKNAAALAAAWAAWGVGEYCEWVSGRTRGTGTRVGVAGWENGMGMVSGQPSPARALRARRASTPRSGWGDPSQSESAFTARDALGEGCPEPVRRASESPRVARAGSPASPSIACVGRALPGPAGALASCRASAAPPPRLRRASAAPPTRLRRVSGPEHQTGGVAVARGNAAAPAGRPASTLTRPCLAGTRRQPPPAPCPPSAAGQSAPWNPQRPPEPRPRTAPASHGASPVTPRRRSAALPPCRADAKGRPRGRSHRTAQAWPRGPRSRNPQAGARGGHLDHRQVPALSGRHERGRAVLVRSVHVPPRPHEHPYRRSVPPLRRDPHLVARTRRGLTLTCAHAAMMREKNSLRYTPPSSVGRTLRWRPPRACTAPQLQLHPQQLLHTLKQSTRPAARQPLLCSPPPLLPPAD